MRENIFKMFFRKEWDRQQQLIDTNQRRAEQLEHYNKDIVIIRNHFNNLSGVDKRLLTENGRLIHEEMLTLEERLHQKELEMKTLRKQAKDNEKLRRTLEHYYKQILNDESLIYDGELCAERDETEKAWSVCVAVCQVGGCEIDSKSFESKAVAEVFASLNNILGYRMEESICSKCRREHYE